MSTEPEIGSLDLETPCCIQLGGERCSRHGPAVERPAPEGCAGCAALRAELVKLADDWERWPLNTTTFRTCARLLRDLLPPASPLPPRPPGDLLAECVRDFLSHPTEVYATMELRAALRRYEAAPGEPREAPRPDPESRIVWPPWMCRLVETRSVFPAGLGRCLRVEDITAAMEAEEARAAAAPREAPARDYPIADAETWRLAYGEKCESLDKAEALLAAARRDAETFRQTWLATQQELGAAREEIRTTLLAEEERRKLTGDALAAEADHAFAEKVLEDTQTALRNALERAGAAERERDAARREATADRNQLADSRDRFREAWRDAEAEVAAAEARERALREALEGLIAIADGQPYSGTAIAIARAVLAEEGSPRGR